MRAKLMRHRADTSCAACHNLMDPIGFGLENFDWMGRWRDKEANGKPVDAAGTMPSGEKFNGPVELRQVLLNRKDDFVRHLTGKVLGYALGRSLQDGDQCTVQTARERAGEGQLSCADADPRSGAERAVPQYAGRDSGDHAVDRAGSAKAARAVAGREVKLALASVIRFKNCSYNDSPI